MWRINAPYYFPKDRKTRQKFHTRQAAKGFAEAGALAGSGVFLGKLAKGAAEEVKFDKNDQGMKLLENASTKGKKAVFATAAVPAAYGGYHATRAIMNKQSRGKKAETKEGNRVRGGATYGLQKKDSKKPKASKADKIALGGALASGAVVSATASEAVSSALIFGGSRATSEGMNALLKRGAGGGFGGAMKRIGGAAKPRIGKTDIAAAGALAGTAGYLYYRNKKGKGYSKKDIRKEVQKGNKEIAKVTANPKHPRLEKELITAGAVAGGATGMSRGFGGIVLGAVGGAAAAQAGIQGAKLTKAAYQGRLKSVYGRQSAIATSVIAGSAAGQGASFLSNKRIGGKSLGAVAGLGTSSAAVAKGSGALGGAITAGAVLKGIKGKMSIHKQKTYGLVDERKASKSSFRGAVGQKVHLKGAYPFKQQKEIMKMVGKEATRTGRPIKVTSVPDHAIRHDKLISKGYSDDFIGKTSVTLHPRNKFHMAAQYGSVGATVAGVVVSAENAGRYYTGRGWSGKKAGAGLALTAGGLALSHYGHKASSKSAVTRPFGHYEAQYKKGASGAKRRAQFYTRKARVGKGRGRVKQQRIKNPNFGRAKRRR